MPTPDDPAPSPRRRLGRGPGSATAAPAARPPGEDTPAPPEDGAPAERPAAHAAGPPQEFPASGPAPVPEALPVAEEEPARSPDAGLAESAPDGLSGVEEPVATRGGPAGTDGGGLAGPAADGASGAEAPSAPAPGAESQREELGGRPPFAGEEPAHGEVSPVPAPAAEPQGEDLAGPGADGPSGAEEPSAPVAGLPEGGAPARSAPGAEPQGEELAEPAPEGDGRFTVRLDNFEGPFDLLLQLISKHKLDVTEVALSKVTDEFMVYIRAMGTEFDLDQTTEFLVVAATLLDLKAARLLPAAEIEDEADLALLEARDLLFARLLQYRAYKEIADIFADRLAQEARRYPRTVGLEPHHAELLPDVVISIGGEGFAKLAVKAMQPKPKPQVYVEHIHAPLVSVREQAEVVVARLRELGRVSFRQLTEDAPDTLTVVARFLALLELYRERAVDLDQEEPLADITIRWSGSSEEDAESLVTDEFDQPPPAPQQSAQSQQPPPSQPPQEPQEEGAPT